MRNDKFDLAEEIKHLSDEQIEELYNKYISGEKNSDLIEEFEIKATPNSLHRLFPPIIHKEAICPYCEESMYSKRKSKSQGSWDSNTIRCFNCDHVIYNQKNSFYSRTCSCSNCRKQEEIKALEKEREKKVAINSIWSLNDRPPIAYCDLEFFDKLVLLTLFRMQSDGGFTHILSLDDPHRTEQLSPTERMDLECLRRLYRSNVLAVDPDSRLEAFPDEEEFNSFLISKVRWIPNISIHGTERSEFSTIYNTLYNELEQGIQSHWEDEIFEVLFTLAKEEVLQYVYVRADELRVEFSAENKTREVVNQLLQDFSVSEIYYFVKKAVENAHLYYQRGYANNQKHAGNTIPNKILSLGERAINEGWDTYKYNRDSRAPRSYLSRIFFDFLLKDIDAGFLKAPGKLWENTLYPRHFCEASHQEANEESPKCRTCGSGDIEIKMTSSMVVEILCKDCGEVSEFKNTKS